MSLVHFQSNNFFHGTIEEKNAVKENDLASSVVGPVFNQIAVSSQRLSHLFEEGGILACCPSVSLISEEDIPEIEALLEEMGSGPVSNLGELILEDEERDLRITVTRQNFEALSSTIVVEEGKKKIFCIEGVILNMVLKGNILALYKGTATLSGEIGPSLQLINIQNGGTVYYHTPDIKIGEVSLFPPYATQMIWVEEQIYFYADIDLSHDLFVQAWDFSQKKEKVLLKPQKSEPSKSQAPLLQEVKPFSRMWGAAFNGFGPKKPR